MPIDILESIASQHEADGGTCKTINVNGAAVKCCLDANGNIKGRTLAALAYLTGQ
jgi:hypothetical protein